MRTLQSCLLSAVLYGCQMVNVNTGSGTLSSMPATTVSPPVTIPVQVGPGGLPSLPSLPDTGTLFMLPMPPQPIVVKPPAPIVIQPGMTMSPIPANPPVVVNPTPVPEPGTISPDPNFPAGVPPSARFIPRFRSTALAHSVFAP